MVNIEVASNNADVAIRAGDTPQTKRLAFSHLDWDTPHTVTVTVAQDGDRGHRQPAPPHRRDAEQRHAHGVAATHHLRERGDAARSIASATATDGGTSATLTLAATGVVGRTRRWR